MQSWAHWQDVPARSWPWRFFTPREMACRGSDRLVIDESFMDALEALRLCFGPLIVTSGYRSPEHNAAVSHTKASRGPHTLALAVDVKVAGADGHRLVETSARLGGWSGIGIGRGFVHLDRVPLSDPEIPRPAAWGYGE